MDENLETMLGVDDQDEDEDEDGSCSAWVSLGFSIGESSSGRYIE